jgi:hypothetical protein
MGPDTLKGVDDLIRAEFQAYRGSCFNWLLAATGIVVVGLVLEGPELWHEIISIARNWRFARRFHLAPPKDHAPDWAKLLASLGWLLIVAGVGGEYVADSFVSKADGYVQTLDEILLTEAQSGAAFARDRASAAYERASENEKETADTLKHAEQERADAAKSLAAAETARKEAEGFQLQIAQANERAADAELETDRLRKQLADRTLTDEEVKSIGQKLKVFGGQSYTVTAYWDSPESLGIANRIHLALNTVAGWSYSDEGSKAMMMGGAVGVLIWTHPDAGERTKKAATALIDALNAEGIEAFPRLENPKNPKSDMIAINVGSKR